MTQKIVTGDPRVNLLLKGSVGHLQPSFVEKEAL
jgi:hypothetical protein